MRDAQNFSDECLEAISLLAPDDPVRIAFEVDLVAAPAHLRDQYAHLLAEAGNFRDALSTPVPATLAGRLSDIPSRSQRLRHSRFLTPFRAAAAAAIVLMLLAPATAWLVPSGGYQRLEQLPEAAVAAADSPIEVPGTRPSNLGETFAASPLSFFAVLPEPKRGTQFLGGGLTTLAGRPAAFGRYRANHKNFTLFLVSLNDFPLVGDGDLSLVTTPEGDSIMRYWTDGPSATVMVAEPGGPVDPDEVVEVRPLRDTP